jgi:hypothetical protein
MAGRLRNPIIQNQAAFMVFEGVMCVVLNVFHPGEIFQKSRGYEGNESQSSADATVDTKIVTRV